jgi:hypothetical protein
MTNAPDAQARQRQLVLQIAAYWKENPAQNPVIIAGAKQ